MASGEEPRATAGAKCLLNGRGQRGAATRKIKEAETLVSSSDPDLVRLRQFASTLEERMEALK